MQKHLNQIQRFSQTSLRKRYIENCELTRCKQYGELEDQCHVAVLLGEKALLGLPFDHSLENNPAYAPYNPDNFSIWQYAANLGITDGFYLLGQNLINRGQIEEGVRWLKIAISKGHKQARRAFGEALLDNGKTHEGLKLLEEAANSGDAYACDALAMRYQEGDGLPKSRSKYRLYLKRAARLGSVFAQDCLDADNLTSGGCLALILSVQKSLLRL